MGKDFEGIWIEKIGEYVVGKEIDGMEWPVMHERIGVRGRGASMLVLYGRWSESSWFLRAIVLCCWRA